MEDWQVGDHAVCVEDCTYRHPDCSVSADIPDIYFRLGPRKGQRFIVAGVELHEMPEHYETQREVYLRLCGMPSDKAYAAKVFRKIDQVEADDEAVQVISEMTSQPEQVPA